MNRKLYKDIPLLELIAGDTLPAYRVTVMSGGKPVPGTMQLIVSRAENPETAVLIRDCTPADGAFSVTVTGRDTARLNGEYVYHLAFFAAGGSTYRRLAGRLIVHPAAQGGSNG